MWDGTVSGNGNNGQGDLPLSQNWERGLGGEGGRFPTRIFVTLTLLILSLPTFAQSPRISALFPAGAKAGETIQVSVRGGGLLGPSKAIVTGPGGVSAEIASGTVKVDDRARPLFQAKCTTCHEARSPFNRSMNAEQWAQTVDRMIKDRSAQIDKNDRDIIVGYLQELARAGEVKLKVSVAPDAAPGMREVRLQTEQGATTAYLFEVGTLPEVNSVEPNSKPEQAQPIALPVVVNGTLGNSAEKDYFTFDAKRGQRVAFNLKGYRINEFSQTFFNPVLYLYDANGKELSKNLGKMGLDPALEWTAPADGKYTILVRDLLWKGNPSSVYRLSVGPLVADGTLVPIAARPGSSISARLMPKEGGSPSEPFSVRVPEGMNGVTKVPTPMGDAPLYVRDLPDRGGPTGAATAAVPLPGVFKGAIVQQGQVEVYRVKAAKGQCALEVYARRLGSPLRARVTIKAGDGRTITSRDANQNDDLRIDNAFPGPGEYLVEVSDADNRSGPAYAYCWEALDGSPDFIITAAPDCINIPPGGAIPVAVRVTRRENLTGPISLSFPDLPPGITATPAVIPPDDDKVVVVLSAAENVARESRVLSVVGTAPGADGATAVRRAKPLEIIRYNGQQRLVERGSLVTATTADPPPFTLRAVVDRNTLQMTVDKETKFTVKITRNPGFRGDLILGVMNYPGLFGLPPGVGINSFVYIPRDKDEGTITLRADGNARFLKERPFPNLPPMQIVIVGFINGGDGTPAACTVPLTLENGG